MEQDKPLADKSSPAESSDLPKALSTLAQAMTALAQSQQAILQTLQNESTRRAVPEQPAAATPSDFGGEAMGGVGPGAVLDYSKLSPVQQITLGLRTSPPAGGARSPEKP